LKLIVFRKKNRQRISLVFIAVTTHIQDMQLPLCVGNSNITLCGVIKHLVTDVNCTISIRGIRFLTPQIDWCNKIEIRNSQNHEYSFLWHRVHSKTINCFAVSALITHQSERVRIKCLYVGCCFNKLVLWKSAWSYTKKGLNISKE
jgi:hypothetical protein